MARAISTFNPDWVSPPGDTILDLLEEHGWKQTELAKRTGYSTKHINLIINGKAPITDDTALKLERVIGSTAHFWLTREAQYREGLVRIAEREALRTEAGWLKQLPLKEMISFGWVRAFQDKGEQVAECLRFFGVATVALWEKEYGEPCAAFRTSDKFENLAGSVAAWLRQGERSAATMKTEAYDRGTFKEALASLRTLTREPAPEVFVPKLIETCARSGVAVVIEPAPKGCPASGAVLWISPEKALLMLSLRHKTNDHFWFSFFHEAGHLIRHGKRLRFIEMEGSLSNEHEEEANQFARDWLIPPQDARQLKTLEKTEAAVSSYAAHQGIAAGIVVGRMQKEGLLPWSSSLNKLKVRYEWVHPETTAS
ncbi:helix-turn-helix domain-containing protein [Geomonas sp. Red32]|uniref:helix-turn-helix domain-containing protein n=1 Tax=Geomonas sp. Red32 TaxID=2912856 RepID=UPI00202CADC1|nr:helix-turn-helix domain-containing protein [Geomonas sp. Red32]MCM0080577.1 helix-turn-helix domain-containing protein [Geomonas sp. Red32]